jgi:hypothetical protein
MAVQIVWRDVAQRSEVDRQDLFNKGLAKKADNLTMGVVAEIPDAGPGPRTIYWMKKTRLLSPGEYDGPYRSHKFAGRADGRPLVSVSCFF